MWTVAAGVLLAQLTYSASPSAAVPTPTAEAIACTGITVLTGNSTVAPATVTFQINVQNAGLASGYRVNFGDSRTEELTSPQVSHTYSLPGTYTISAEIKDNAGKWVADSRCQTAVVALGAPATPPPPTKPAAASPSARLTVQPKTGVETGVWAALGVALISGTGLVFLAYYRKPV